MTDDHDLLAGDLAQLERQPMPPGLGGRIMAAVEAERGRRSTTARLLAALRLPWPARLAWVACGIAVGLGIGLWAPPAPQAPEPLQSGPVVTQRQSGTPVRFVFQKRGARSVCVVGDFNAWNPAVSPLRDDGSGVWTGTVALEPGLHEYMFVVDGIEFVADPAAVEYRPDGFGSRNAVLRI